VVFEVIPQRAHAVEAHQVVEQRVARNRYQHVVSMRFAQQLEEQRVRFARAGGQQHVFRSNADAAAIVLARNRRARGR
jgi:hypothetical protein